VLNISWNLLNTVFTVESLMTPRDELVTREFDGSEEKLLESLPSFDIIPVCQGQRIIGVLEKGIPSIQPLSDRWLITRDTSIPDLLDLFVELKQKAFLVFYRREVIGLVTPADLNKLPARAYVYNLIGELEIGLAGLIRTKYNESADSLLGLLSNKRQSEMATRHYELLEGNADVDLLQSLNLSDLIGIVEKVDVLRKEIGLASRNKAEQQFSGLNDLRNQVMHLVKPLLTSVPDDLITLQDRIDRAMALLEQL
jgi:hypothetical protein